MAATYRHFGQEPYFSADGKHSRSENTDVEPLGHIERASKLLHYRVKNMQGEELGAVQALMFELPKDTMSHVIIESAGFVKSKSAIPATAFKYNASHDGLVLDVSSKAFLTQPRMRWIYSSRKWNNAAIFDEDPNFQQQTFSNTKVAANDGVNTRQRVTEGSAVAYTPLAQGTSFRDVDVTHRIYYAMLLAMVADKDLSADAQNIEVGTVDGRVTLRGQVSTDDEKRVINDIAGTIVRPENVSNLLDVKPGSNRNR